MKNFLNFIKEHLTSKAKNIVAVEPLPKEYIKELWKNVEIPTLSEKIVASFYLIMFLGRFLMSCISTLIAIEAFRILESFYKNPSKAGLCANALVICVLLLNKGSLKAPPGIYVFHMSFADSMLLFSLPFAADNRLRGFEEYISL